MTDEGRIKITLPLSAEQRAAWAEYVKVSDAARAEYVKVRDAAWAEYDKVRAAAWAEYDKVRAAAWAEYAKVDHSSPLVTWIVGNYLNDHEAEVDQVLSALSDGASWGDLQDLARAQGWCEVWNIAVAAARERFDIS